MLNPPSFCSAFLFWLKLGFVSFGGPTGQIAIMHEEVVEGRKWISDNQFSHALNYCMLLPGPEAQQLAIYIGWLLHGTLGGIVAGTLFVLPSLFILITLSWIYAVYGKVTLVAGAFWGLSSVVMALVLVALTRIAKKSLKTKAAYVLAIVSAVALTFLKIPFPVVLITSALLGLAASFIAPHIFYPAQMTAKESWTSRDVQGHLLIRSIKILICFAVLWISPYLFLKQGFENIYTTMALFFTKVAMATFGGAYAVLPYIAQMGVEHYGWLSASQMMAGLGLAETTPGPLIMVVAFVGYMGAFAHSTVFSPAAAGAIGATVATYFTFLPSFLWILLGAPIVEKLKDNVHARVILSAISASVVGVLVYLALYFGKHVFYPQEVDLKALSLFVLSWIGLHKFNWSPIWTILGGGVVGVLISLI